MSFHRKHKVCRRAQQKAFSLVEVAMSLAIFGVVVVPIIGLLVTGMGISRNAVDTQVLERISQQVVPQARENPTGTRIFTDQGFLVQPGQIQIFRAEWSNVTTERNTLTGNAVRSLARNNYREIVITHIPSNRVVKRTFALHSE